MGRIVEVLVGVSALAGIATFLGLRTATRATLRTLGRKPESPPSPLRTPKGRVLADTEIEELANEAERGYEVEELKERRTQ